MGKTLLCIFGLLYIMFQAGAKARPSWGVFFSFLPVSERIRLDVAHYPPPLISGSMMLVVLSITTLQGQLEADALKMGLTVLNLNKVTLTAKPLSDSVYESQCRSVCCLSIPMVIGQIRLFILQNPGMDTFLPFLK